ncbi:MAG: SRPBCC family protein [Actinomycetota bacterium]|nr:SRPBCC family protein [Actinomycetota bacterium]
MGILIENEFEVPAPIDRVWAYLLDVEHIAPCMPGAQLTEVVDDRNWKGKVTVKLGPVSLSFAGTVHMEERDDDTHRVVVKAQGMEQKGKGAATALVTAWAEAADGGHTRVKFSQDLTISGAVAQFSRGMMQDVSGRMTKQFADCVQANLSQEEAEAAPAPAPASGQAPSRDAPPPAAAAVPRPAPVTAKPPAGIRLGLWALWRAVVRFFKRLFGGGRGSS